MAIQRYHMKTTAYESQRSYTRLPVRLQLDLDWDKLARHLADKAYSNSSKTTRFLSGIIVAKIIKEGD